MSKTFKTNDTVKINAPGNFHDGEYAIVIAEENTQVFHLELCQSGLRIYCHIDDLEQIEFHDEKTQPIDYVEFAETLKGKPAVIHDQADTQKTGNRFNNGKIRYRNFPLWLMKPLVEVGTRGEEKYGTFNFLKGLKVADCLDSMDRHRENVDDPNASDFDAESKLHHLAHVAWNALVALHMIKTRPDLDDRYKTQVSKEKQNG